MPRFWNRIRRSSSAAASRPGLFAGGGGYERGPYLAAVTVVAAKLAKSDGPVRRVEIDAFKRLFPITPDERASIGPLFDQARETSEGFLPFAVHLAEMLAHAPDAAADLLERLHGVAVADGVLCREESDYLAAVARVLRLEAHWEELQLRTNAEGDPYEVLGLGRDATDQEVRAAWRRLMRRYHPDAVSARGESDASHDRTVAINSAYRRIMQARRHRRAYPL